MELLIVLYACVVTAVDGKTKRMAKKRKLGAKTLASNHEINREIKYKIICASNLRISGYTEPISH